MLLSFFRNIKRRAEAIKIADTIAPALDAASGLFLLRDDKREIYKAVLEDEFVLSYLYGAILFYIEVLGVNEEETERYIAWEVYKRLFPGHGKSVLRVWGTGVTERNESFKSGIKTGFREMKGVWDSPEEGRLQSLNDHLSNLQRRMS